MHTPEPHILEHLYIHGSARLCSHLARSPLPRLPVYPYKVRTHTSLSLTRCLARSSGSSCQHHGLPRACGPHRRQGPLPVPEPSLTRPPCPGPGQPKRASDLPSDRVCLPLSPDPPSPTPPQGAGCSPRSQTGSPRLASVSHIRPTPETPRGPLSPAWTAGPTTPAPWTPSSLRYVHRQPFFLRPQRASHTLPCSGTGQQARHESGRWEDGAPGRQRGRTWVPKQRNQKFSSLHIQSASISPTSGPCSGRHSAKL